MLPYICYSRHVIPYLMAEIAVQRADDNLSYDLEYLRLCVEEDQDAGLAEWEMVIAVYRNLYLLDEYHQSVAEAERWPLICR